MFQLGFSSVHLGYSLIFAMVLAGFYWNDSAYYRWEVTDCAIFPNDRRLDWHCDRCRSITISKLQQSMSPQEKQFWSACIALKKSIKAEFPDPPILEAKIGRLSANQ